MSTTVLCRHISVTDGCYVGGKRKVYASKPPDGRADPDEILLNTFLEDREHHHISGLVRPTALRPEGFNGVKDLKGADARNGDNKDRGWPKGGPCDQSKPLPAGAGPIYFSRMVEFPVHRRQTG